MNSSSVHRNHKKSRSLLEMPTPIETNKFLVNVMDFPKQIHKLKYTSCFREVNKTKPSYYGEEIKNPIFPSPEISKVSSTERKQIRYDSSLPALPKVKSIISFSLKDIDEEKKSRDHYNMNSIQSAKYKNYSNISSIKSKQSLTKKVNKYDMKFIYPASNTPMIQKLFSGRMGKKKKKPLILDSNTQHIMYKVSSIGQNKKYQFISFEL